MLNNSYLDLASAGFAALAAVLWLCSALVKFPREFPIEILSLHSAHNEVAGAQVISSGSSPQLDEIAQGLVFQSKLSAAGAMAAAVAAGIQAWALYIK